MLLSKLSYELYCCCSAAKSSLSLCDHTETHQALPSLPVSRSLLRSVSIESMMRSNHLILLSSCPQSFPASGSFVSSSHQVAKILELQHQPFQGVFRTDLLQDGLVGSPCSPRDSQESSATPQFESISSSVLSLPVSNILNVDFIDVSQKLRDFWPLGVMFKANIL